MIPADDIFKRGWRRLLGAPEDIHGVWEATDGTIIAANTREEATGDLLIEYTRLSAPDTKGREG